MKGGPADNRATVAQLADELGKSERTVKTMRTLADLIPSLSAMLDARTLELWTALNTVMAALDELRDQYAHAREG